MGRETMPNHAPHVPSAAMNTTAIVLALGLAAPLVLTTGCSKKSDDTGAVAPTTVAPAAAKCPAGSSMAGTSCKGSGQSRVGTLTWNGALGDSGQVLMLRNTSGAVMKAGTVSLWFYDKSGKRLDVAGGKKYATPGDAFGSNVKAGESRNITVPLTKTGIPDGTAEIEGEIVAVTLVNGDGTDGPGWKNDDLNADERVMTGTPSATVPAVVATGTLRPGIRKPPPPPPPPHR